METSGRFAEALERIADTLEEHLAVAKRIEGIQRESLDFTKETMESAKAMANRDQEVNLWQEPVETKP